MKQYEKLKKSNVSWLPEIPAHWEMSKSKYYFRYTTGFTPPTGVAEFYDGDITWITIADMNQKVVFDSATKLSQTAIDKYNPDLTLKDSLLYSFKLSVGKVAYAGKDLYTNEAIISILPNKKYDLRYFYYTLPEQLLQNASENIYGAKMLNQELIRNASICFPPKEDQIAIASFLDEKTAQIDTLIVKKQKLIDLLKEERMAMINHAVTKGISPKVKLKPSGVDWLGEIPKHWRVVPMTKYLESIIDYRGRTPTKSESGIFLVTARNIKNGKINYDLAQEFILEEEYEKTMSRGELKEGDVLFTTEAPLGEVANVDRTDIAVAQRIIKFRGKKNIVNNYYLKYWIMSPFFQQDLNSLSTGSTAIGIKASKLFMLKLMIPPFSEQAIILDYITTKESEFDAAISKIEKEIELLQEYRAALISEVVTGKVKVI